MLAHVPAAFAMSDETYGPPRMHAELTEHDLAIGRHRVARLMRENGLQARQKTRFKRTNDGAPRRACLEQRPRSGRRSHGARPEIGC